MISDVRVNRAFAAVAVVGIAATGCASSTDGIGAVARPTGGSSVPASSPISRPARSVPDKATLARVVLRPTDLPPGWTATPHESDPNDPGAQAALARCTGVSDSGAGEVAEADSPDFGQEGATISSSATSYRSQADIDADVALLKNPKVSACFRQLLRTAITSSLPPGAKLDAVSSKITPGTGGGPSDVVGIVRATVTMTVSDVRVVVYMDMAFITGRLIEAEVEVVNPRLPISDSVFFALVRDVATRAALA